MGMDYLGPGKGGNHWGHRPSQEFLLSAPEPESELELESDSGASEMHDSNVVREEQSECLKCDY